MYICGFEQVSATWTHLIAQLFAKLSLCLRYKPFVPNKATLTLNFPWREIPPQNFIGGWIFIINYIISATPRSIAYLSVANVPKVSDRIFKMADFQKIERWPTFKKLKDGGIFWFFCCGTYESHNLFHDDNYVYFVYQFNSEFKKLFSSIFINICKWKIMGTFHFFFFPTWFAAILELTFGTLLHSVSFLFWSDFSHFFRVHSFSLLRQLYYQLIMKLHAISPIVSTLEFIQLNVGLNIDLFISRSIENRYLWHYAEHEEQWRLCTITDIFVLCLKFILIYINILRVTEWWNV